MALSLDVRAGDKFFLKNVPVTVRSFAGYYSATVEVNGKSFDLSHEQSLEIYPRVRVSCGHPVSGKVERYKAAHRLLIDAPLSIRIPIAICKAAQSVKVSCAAKLNLYRRRNSSYQAAPRRLQIPAISVSNRVADFLYPWNQPVRVLSNNKRVYR
jgi:hypothetical protein